MKRLIAVVSYPRVGSMEKGEWLRTPARVLAAVKQSCLLFDHIAPLYLGSPRIHRETYSDPVEDAKTCNLFSEGKVWFKADLTRLVEQVSHDVTPRAAAMTTSLSALTNQKTDSWTIEHSMRFWDEVSRIMSCALRETKGIDSVPIIFNKPSTPHQTATSETSARLDDVMQIVINAFPKPDVATPIEKIMDFRQNPTTKSRIISLRRWMKKIASSNVSVEDAADELEWLLHRPRSAHAAIQRMKVNYGTLETLLTTGAEALEAAVKLKFGTLAKIPFAIQRRELALLEAERGTPGREIAYIAEARKQFNAKKLPARNDYVP